MSAPHIDLADAVAAAMTTFADGDYTAVRAYVPKWRLDELTEAPKVAVVPADLTRTRADRSTAANGMTIDVGFTAKLADSTKEECDALAEVVYAAFDHLAPTGAGEKITTTDGRQVRAIEASFKAIFDPESLAAKTEGDPSGVFLSVFSIVYRELPQ